MHFMFSMVVEAASIERSVLPATPVTAPSVNFQLSTTTAPALTDDEMTKSPPFDFVIACPEPPVNNRSPPELVKSALMVRLVASDIAPSKNRTTSNEIQLFAPVPAAFSQTLLAHFNA